MKYMVHYDFDFQPTVRYELDAKSDISAVLRATNYVDNTLRQYNKKNTEKSRAVSFSVYATFYVMQDTIPTKRRAAHRIFHGYLLA